MRKLFTIFAALILALPIYGQKIETRDPNRDQIVQVKTAIKHLTVIQVAEPVLSVAAGSEAFKVEWRGNKVFVEPTEAGVSTNLFIWTKSGRENYELEPAGAVGSMDFAIDTPAPDLAPSPKPAAKAAVPGNPMKLAAEAMLGGTPVRQESWKLEKRRVQVMVRDLFEQDGNLYIRYSIANGTKKAYAPGTPRVVEMAAAVSPAALAAHACTQLSKETAGNFRTNSEAPLLITAHTERRATVPPGDEAVGVVGVKLAGSGSTVLRLEFRDDRGRPVSAVVVI
ncbi:MAG: hypothetical protein ACRD18_04885 [Terriglobia bacterium]